MINPRRAPTARYVNVEFTPARGTHQAAAAPPRPAHAPPAGIDALYLHVPFCFHKCHYCDFYSIVDAPDAEGGADRQQPFVDALIAELAARVGEFPMSPRTLFVGGGTPTLLRPPLWRRLLRDIAQLGLLQHVREFTVEANPETVTAELMDVLVAGGVNRVSMGAQSSQPELLRALERWHDPASVPRAAAIVRAAGIVNLNLDLIFAIPGQTLDQLDADLDAALALQPTHLSCYGLTYEPNTALTTKLRLGRIRPIEEDVEAQMYDRVLNRLAAAGFEHYEVSNWAKADVAGPAASNRCAHNLAYWSNLNWLGIGPSASSHVAGRRWKNDAHLRRYLAGSPNPPIVDEEFLPEARRVGEQLMLRLRLREGAADAWLREHLPADDDRWATIDELAAQGFLERADGHVRLTRRGLFVADAVIAKLL